jgi:outer membrane protein assembly factor BamB
MLKLRPSRRGGCPRLLICILALQAACVPAGGTPATSAEQADQTQAGQTQAARVEDLWSRRQGEDWESFLGPRGDGTSTETGIDPQLWSPHPRLLWTLDLGTSYAGPAVSRGRLLQFDRVGNRERLSCYRAETCQRLWQRDDAVEYEDLYGYNNGPRCMPVVAGDFVYTYGVAGRLNCVTLADGQLVWSRDMNADYGVVQNFFGVASTPLVHGNKLIVMVGGSPPQSQFVPPGRLDLVKPNGSGIVVLDRFTGRELYRVGDELASYSSPMVAQVGSRTLGMALLRGGLLAFDPESGKELFTFPWRSQMLESVNAAQPVVAGERILISEAYEIASVLIEPQEAASGRLEPQVVWRDGATRREQAFRAHWSTPALIDGYLYGCSGRNGPDSDFRCVRLEDAAVMWMDRRHERSSVLAIDGYLIVLGEMGLLELVRPQPGKLEVVKAIDLNRLADPGDGQSLIDPPAWAAPVVAHGLLFVRGNSKLLCFDLIPAP